MDNLNKKQKQLIKDYKKATIQLKKRPTFVELKPFGVSQGKVRTSFGGLIKLEQSIAKISPSFFKKYKAISPSQDILSIYKRLLLKTKTPPSLADMSENGVTSSAIRHSFKNMAGLEAKARKEFGNLFKNVVLDTVFTESNAILLKDEIKKYKRFVITTAVSGCEVDGNFYESIKNYCKKNKAKLLILIATDPAANVSRTIDKLLENESIVVEDTSLNSNIFLSTIKLSAKHIDPITSLGRIGQRSGSFVYASPKQRLKLVPVSNMGVPHALMTTGAITKPNYKTNDYMSERTAYIAENDHVMGGIVVEVVDDKRYHFRQIQSDVKFGSFIDLGKEYWPNEVKPAQPEAFVLGDWHSGETDLATKKAWFEVAKLLKPKSIVLHDAFNGMAINHHEKHSNILLAKRAMKSELNLAEEICYLADDLLEISELTDKVVIVKSNHDEFLNRYLQEGIYVKDHHNHLTGVTLARAMLEGHDPLSFAVFCVYEDNKDILNKMKKKLVWLKRDDDYKVSGIQLAAHGDKGANGSKGNVRGMEHAYSSSVTGHSHTPEILRGAWSVGTSSYLRLSYNSGPSSWLHSSCLVYKNGQRQLINAFEGSWRLK